MAKLNTKLRGCSQESSVSSLLASGSLSGSRSDSAHSAHSSFVYKDQLYSSASEALQAYIDDFDLSREHPGANAVKVNTDLKTHVPGQKVQTESKAVSVAYTSV